MKKMRNKSERPEAVYYTMKWKNSWQHQHQRVNEQPDLQFTCYKLIIRSAWEAAAHGERGLTQQWDSSYSTRILTMALPLTCSKTLHRSRPFCASVFPIIFCPVQIDWILQDKARLKADGWAQCYPCCISKKPQQFLRLRKGKVWMKHWFLIVQLNETESGGSWQIIAGSLPL